MTINWNIPQHAWYAPYSRCGGQAREKVGLRAYEFWIRQRRCVQRYRPLSEPPYACTSTSFPTDASVPSVLCPEEAVLGAAEGASARGVSRALNWAAASRTSCRVAASREKNAIPCAGASTSASRRAVGWSGLPPLLRARAARRPTNVGPSPAGRASVPVTCASMTCMSPSPWSRRACRQQEVLETATGGGRLEESIRDLARQTRSLWQPSAPPL